MSFDFPDLADLDPQLVQQEMDVVVTKLQEFMPRVDMRRGVVHDHVLYPHAVLSAGQRTLLNQYLSRFGG